MNIVCADMTARFRLVPARTPALSDVRTRLEMGQISGLVEAAGVSDGKRALTFALNQCGACKVHEPVLIVTEHGGLGTNKPTATIRVQTLITQAGGEMLVAAQASRMATVRSV